MIKKKHTHYFSLLFSFIFFILTYINYTSKNSYYNKRIESLRVGNSEISNNINKLNKALEKEQEKYRKNKETYKLIQEIGNEKFSLQDTNVFVAGFETILKDYDEVQKVKYESNIQDKKISINIDYYGEYSRLRSLIYELEKEFYFLNISYLRAEQEEGPIRANINIQTYFRGEEDK